MSIKELLLSLAHYLASLLLRKYTGTVIVTLNMRDGGIGKVSIHTDFTLPKNTKPIKELDILVK